MNETPDDMVEMICVRLNRTNDPNVVKNIVKDWADLLMQPSCQLQIAKLFKNRHVDNDWAIYLQFFPSEKDGKSIPAISLADALRTVGLVHHTVWHPCDMEHHLRNNKEIRVKDE